MWPLLLLLWATAYAEDPPVTIKTVLLRSPESTQLTDTVTEGVQPYLTFAVYIDKGRDDFIVDGIMFDDVHFLELDNNDINAVGEHRHWDEIEPCVSHLELDLCKTARKCAGFAVGAWAFWTKIFENAANASHHFRAHIPVTLLAVNTSATGGSQRRLLSDTVIVINDQPATVTFLCRTCGARDTSVSTAGFALFVLAFVFLFVVCAALMIDSYDFSRTRSKSIDSYTDS